MSVGREAKAPLKDSQTKSVFLVAAHERLTNETSRNRRAFPAAESSNEISHGSAQLQPTSTGWTQAATEHPVAVSKIKASIIYSVIMHILKEVRLNYSHFRKYNINKISINSEKINSYFSFLYGMLKIR